ncbi:type II toxin-antitoxin system HicA family toxin [Chitinophaga sp. 22620]|uniref:type II toxin-antitoxin system HicA family toxin n=1 Tax=Chitinophaga sp. 22620 TaxID=3453952 RepID=UPI003F846A11
MVSFLKSNKYITLTTKCSELKKKLLNAGWVILRQGKGSHIILIYPDKPGKRIVFTDHGSNEIGKGLERKILKQAGLI